MTWTFMPVAGKEDPYDLDSEPSVLVHTCKQAPSRPPQVGDLVAYRMNHTVGNQIRSYTKNWHGPLVIKEVVGDIIVAGCIVLTFGYGDDFDQWKYVEEVELPHPDYQRFLSMRVETHGHIPRHDLVPPCENCGAWPCLKKEGCRDWWLEAASMCIKRKESKHPPIAPSHGDHHQWEAA